MPVLVGFPLTLTGLELQGSHQSRKTNSFTQVKERQLLLILCCSWQGVVNGAAPPRFVGEGLRFCTHLAALPRTCSLTLNKLLDSSAPQCCCLKNG